MKLAWFYHVLQERIQGRFSVDLWRESAGLLSPAQVWSEAELPPRVDVGVVEVLVQLIQSRKPRGSAEGC